MEKILEINELSKVYQLGKQEHLVLDRVTLQISRGEFVAVMGPSGSGKSTLLYNISGMDRLTSGKVDYNGHELGKRSERKLAEIRLQEMGFIFQHMHLLKNLSLLDNIILPAYQAKKESRSSINKRALALMERTGIAELAGRSISEASGGQLQRAAICRALINEPAMIFGDEPTGALNTLAAGEVMDILREVNRDGTTILLVTHDVKVAAQTERILFMVDGRIAGEKVLGRYEKGDQLREREVCLAGWLQEMGF